MVSATDFNKIMTVTEHYLVMWVKRRGREGITVIANEFQDQAHVPYNAMAIGGGGGAQ